MRHKKLATAPVTSVDEVAVARKKRNALFLMSLTPAQKFAELREMKRTGISWRDPSWKPLTKGMKEGK